jgi:hypothetical protein
MLTIESQKALRACPCRNRWSQISYVRGKQRDNWHRMVPGSENCSMLTEGVWAEVKVGDEHLRLFAEHNAQGVQASVYNVRTKSWIAPSEPVDDIERGKEKAAEHASAYLKQSANSELPPLMWKASRSR